MAWSDDEDSREAADFLARLPNEMLTFLDQKAGGVLDDRVQNVVSELVSELHELDLTPSDLPAQLALSRPNVRALRASVGAILRERANELEEAERKDAADRLRLEKWEPQLQELRQSWIATHPYRRAGGMCLPPVGLGQLISYVEGYLLEHGRMPSGRHEIPSEANAMSGTLNLLVVDFDHLLPADQVNGLRDKPTQ
jgi:hypothetical protein